MVCFKFIRLSTRLLLILNVCMGTALAGDSIEDLRLFFTVDERSVLAREHSELGAMALEVDQGDLESVKSKMELSIEATARRLPHSVNAAITYNAIVNSGPAYLVIVNDVPCKSAFFDNSKKSARLDCEHKGLEKYQLHIRAESARLEIYLANKKVASLLVGERF